MRECRCLLNSKWRRALLLLVSGVIVLMSVGGMRAQSSNPCAETNLPNPVLDMIRTKFSGWRPKNVADLDAEDRELWLKPHLNDCPGIAVGHFESPDRLTHALLLVPQSNLSGGYKLVVFSKVPTETVTFSSWWITRAPLTRGSSLRRPHKGSTPTTKTQEYQSRSN